MIRLQLEWKAGTLRAVDDVLTTLIHESFTLNWKRNTVVKAIFISRESSFCLKRYAQN
jgi:hypothetical protein